MRFDDKWKYININLIYKLLRWILNKLFFINFLNYLINLIIKSNKNIVILINKNILILIYFYI